MRSWKKAVDRRQGRVKWWSWNIEGVINQIIELEGDIASCGAMYRAGTSPGTVAVGRSAGCLNRARRKWSSLSAAWTCCWTVWRSRSEGGALAQHAVLGELPCCAVCNLWFHISHYLQKIGGTEGFYALDICWFQFITCVFFGGGLL